MDLKTATDTDFIGGANRTLVDCRRVLKYTYAYAFTNDDDNHNGSNDSNGSKITG